MDIELIVAKQREYFNSGVTRPLEFRLQALRKLQKAVQDNEKNIAAALKSDLNRHPLESYMVEAGIVLDEIRFHLRNLSKWAGTKKVPTPLSQMIARSFVVPEPYGVALILSPWNYPVQLCLTPLVGAISSGNCAVIKPSIYAESASHVIAKIIREAFPPEYITVVEGGREQNTTLLAQKFDNIFFTGSVAVGKVVMEAAAKNLTPVTLELGGKSPVIVDESADLKLAARRIAFGKVVNAGQTCVAPDYLLIHEGMKEPFVAEYRNAINEFFPDGNMLDMVTIINDKHFRRLIGLMESEKIVIGGGVDATRRFIEPTLLVDITPDAPIMQEEIFGPLLPVMTFQKVDEGIEYIRSHERPLALYLFTKRKEVEEQILNTCSFGGGCINDTVVHVATSYMGFGGVGSSGMGKYHGKDSFDTFTHYRSIIHKSLRMDLKERYHPYTDAKFRTIKKLLR